MWLWLYSINNTSSKFSVIFKKIQLIHFLCMYKYVSIAVTSVPVWSMVVLTRIVRRWKVTSEGFQETFITDWMIGRGTAITTNYFYFPVYTSSDLGKIFTIWANHHHHHHHSYTILTSHINYQSTTTTYLLLWIQDFFWMKIFHI